MKINLKQKKKLRWKYCQIIKKNKKKSVKRMINLKKREKIKKYNKSILNLDL